MTDILIIFSYYIKQHTAKPDVDNEPTNSNEVSLGMMAMLHE